jgi:hypothetical protein
VSGEPVKCLFGEFGGTVNGVHDLQAAVIVAGRADQPVAPSRGFLAVAGGEKGLQGESGIAQPGVAVVPVAGPTEPLRQ